MIKTAALCLALCLCLAEAQRRGGRRQFPRRGREDAAAGGYTAPEDVPVYGASDAVATYEAAGDDPLAALGNSIPGVPGEDYPIYAEVPESGFTCDGQVDGGYYADPDPNAKPSTSAQPTEPSSTRTTSSEREALASDALGTYEAPAEYAGGADAPVDDYSAGRRGRRLGNSRRNNRRGGRRGGRRG